MDWDGFADDVLAVVDAWGRSTDLVAVGHSKGGAALLLAEQRRPGHLRRPVLLRAGGPMPTGPMPAPSTRSDRDDNPLAAGAPDGADAVFESP